MVIGKSSHFSCTANFLAFRFFQNLIDQYDVVTILESHKAGHRIRPSYSYEQE